MTKLRGTPQTTGKTWKQDMIRNNVYDGQINRDYQNLQRFRIAYPGQRPYTANCKKSLKEMQEKHSMAVVTLI